MRSRYIERLLFLCMNLFLQLPIVEQAHNNSNYRRRWCCESDIGKRCVWLYTHDV